MTQAQHTPAPWVISGNTLLHVTGEPANIHIATITECRPSDARLIAAAPDLLAACESAQDAICFEDFPGIYNKLRVAINKAKGI